MNNIIVVKKIFWQQVICTLLLTTNVMAVFAQAGTDQKSFPDAPQSQVKSKTLTLKQQAIVPIAAFATSGNMSKLNGALNNGLDVGLTVSELKEILVQVYAYAGFPRSLNPLDELMKVLEVRRHEGIQDLPGRAPSKPIPKENELLVAGTINQPRLLGAPVEGALFELVPIADEYLKTHLFGDIFERDNLDWQSRDLATVSMLSVLSGVEAQLKSHLRISMNIGISSSQLHQLAHEISYIDIEAVRRISQTLEQ